MKKQYPRRLIEVDLPIRRISAQARREKSIRHGHISTLHIWWARRPLAACRAVICAALWPDPADESCPQAFCDTAIRLINQFAKKADNDLELLETSSEESKKRWAALAKKPLGPTKKQDLCTLRSALLDFIADFANWDNSTVREYLDTSRALTQAAHEALGGAPGTRPLVVDPFCGGGSIPLEALRVGADTFASDLNPVPVLLNKVVLEYIPKYGQRLADEVRKWGEWIKHEAEKELGEFYPKDPDGATPIAYLWARTIQCEGPACGAEVPLIRSLWLAKKANRSVALQLVPRPRAKRVDFRIIVKGPHGWVDQDDPKTTIEDPRFNGTVKRGSATCPCCGYTTPVARVREQLRTRHGGANDAQMHSVVISTPGKSGRTYRLANDHDRRAAEHARSVLRKREESHDATTMPLIPQEELPLMSGVFNAPIYGHTTWGSLFLPRQLLALTTLSRLISDLSGATENGQLTYPEPTRVVLALALDRVAVRCTAQCIWDGTTECIMQIFNQGQAIPVRFEFAEMIPLIEEGSGWPTSFGYYDKVFQHLLRSIPVEGHIQQCSATEHSMPDDSADALVTDPPYYNAVPYADLSDFFYVWLRRTLGKGFLGLFSDGESPKEKELCEMAGWDPVRYPHKDKIFFERGMTKALSEARRVLRPGGIGVVVFANKSTSGWEALLQAMVDAHWVISGSWAIDTESENRLRAKGSAALASSVHLACRPREISDGSIGPDEVGDWRGVLADLPRRIHEWMPRLADEGVVGADAIFACLGPALEIFSSYSRVEKANGEAVSLRNYLEQVWAAVSREALTMIFEGANTEGFEPDSRLTAMWLWTLSTGGNGSTAESDDDDEDEEDEEQPAGKTASKVGFVLEYDAARKIAQGLGAHLEQLTSVVEVKGDKARLLPVAQRTKHLFGKDEAAAPTKARKKKPAQKMLFEPLDEVEEEQGGWGDKSVPALGDTVLDRIHQSMILFAAGRSEALKRFLVEDGVGRDARYWRLAQALSALYPAGTDEKRWVDGVLARKKGLGF